ncbi:MAG: hypothetical protein KDB27_19305, partial [Planctomycetales bacterium]|nr:hypothetical protein [Planctomycetales bacterium]
MSHGKPVDQLEGMGAGHHDPKSDRALPATEETRLGAFESRNSISAQRLAASTEETLHSLLLISWLPYSAQRLAASTEETLFAVEVLRCELLVLNALRH